MRLVRCVNNFRFIRGAHKYLFKMNQAYLRHSPEPGKFEFSIKYVDVTSKVNRQFNFCRHHNETVASFCQRVAANIDKIVKKKNKKQNDINSVEVSVSVNEHLVDNESTLCGEIFSDDLDKNIILNVCEQKFKVLINPPWVNGLALPSSILAGFLIYPTKFDSVFTDKQLSEFTWYKSKDKNKWELVGDGFMYNTQNTDVGYCLKLHCLPKNNKLEGPTIEAISNVEVQAGPGLCPFETRHQFTKEKCQGTEFRVVSYNILADLYCDSDFTRQQLHPYCPAYALEIDYRKQLFVKEITGYNADIICLQEVDRKIYTYDLQPLFDQLEFGSDFCQKRDQVAEGVSCFFNKNRFKLLEAFRFVLSDEINTNNLLADIWSKIQENKALNDRILNRSSVLQVLVLESLENDEILVVGNTHLYFHPDADHIRLLQGAIAGRIIQNILNEQKKKFKKRVSTIFCGDFNSVPSCGIYQLYTTGSIAEDHIDFDSKPEESIHIPLNQYVRFKSACGTPQYTNFTAGFADCLDYIFYESLNFEVTQVVPLPSVEELNQHTALPSIVFPSDHIALISDLKWT